MPIKIKPVLESLLVLAALVSVLPARADLLIHNVYNQTPTRFPCCEERFVVASGDRQADFIPYGSLEREIKLSRQEQSPGGDRTGDLVQSQGVLLLTLIFGRGSPVPEAPPLEEEEEIPEGPTTTSKPDTPTDEHTSQLPPILSPEPTPLLSGVIGGAALAVCFYVRKQRRLMAC